ncbi:hypothetical protein [Nitrosopumilus sp.]|uniref:hypothetical protein n=1 Tax=Nitrosopumilus sp. TaxID=2024843 RepID=UPI00262A2225|nr:hypothetical protein [Nitrosopumilus sp.]
MRRKLSQTEIEAQRKEQKMRAVLSTVAMKSGKILKIAGKVAKQATKFKEPRSQKKIATINKSRY